MQIPAPKNTYVHTQINCKKKYIHTKMPKQPHNGRLMCVSEGRLAVKLPISTSNYCNMSKRENYYLRGNDEVSPLIK